ncbi:MAG TPA: YhjD/YihY/BrkB family envelope integrity protein [Candidatus Saccharimonadales bacterium]
MNIVQKTINGIDAFQRRHKYPAFLIGVIKKYGNDQAGYQAALVTYYGFLALFPLLLILTTVAGIISENNTAFGQRLLEGVGTYFPVFEKTLADSIQGVGRNGFALVVGLLFALYGARGIADAFRNAVNHIWHVPIAKRSGFPRAQIRSFGLIIGGGGGFIAAAVIAGWAASAGRGWSSAIVSVAINLVILYLVFMFIFRVSLPLHIGRNRFRISAIISAIGLATLQMVGAAILQMEAARLANTYSAVFATTLGLLAWIYLQIQVVMYATEIATVKDGRLWPRSLNNDNLTDADKVMEKRQAA